MMVIPWSVYSLLDLAELEILTLFSCDLRSDSDVIVYKVIACHLLVHILRVGVPHFLKLV
jgi:hypothetical protein